MAGLLIFSSCSTIFQGSRQNVTIQSTTPDAKIIVDGADVGKDQVMVKLRRNQDHTIIVKKDGYETKTILLQKNTQAGYVVVDIVLALTGFGLVFIIVDAATGSWHKFDMDRVAVDLDPKK